VNNEIYKNILMGKDKELFTFIKGGRLACAACYQVPILVCGILLYQGTLSDYGSIITAES
jgi:hypothetical protein